MPKVSQKALNSANLRHNFSLQWCWNYERMQATGIAYSLVPVFKELYDTEEEVVENLQRHMQFFNTNPTPSALILGAVVALEEQGEKDMAESLKVGLMGPLAGVGDTIAAVLITPIFSTIGAAMAYEGSMLGVLIMFLALGAWFVVKWPLFNYGYKKSVGIIADVSGGSDLEKYTEVASILGLVVIGGFVPSILGKVKVPYTYSKEIDGLTKEVAVQDTLDGILPYLLPILIVWFCYWLMKSKKVSPIMTIVIVAIAATVLSLLGLLGV